MNVCICIFCFVLQAGMTHSYSLLRWYRFVVETRSWTLFVSPFFCLWPIHMTFFPPPEVFEFFKFYFERGFFCMALVEQQWDGCWYVQHTAVSTVAFVTIMHNLSIILVVLLLSTTPCIFFNWGGADPALINQMGKLTVPVYPGLI